jgi:hypothetical protein
MRIPGWAILSVLGLWPGSASDEASPGQALESEERFPAPAGVDLMDWFRSGEYWEALYDAGECPEGLKGMVEERKARKAQGLPVSVVKRRARPIGRVG